MSEMNEKVEEPQEQAADRTPIPPEQLKKILEAHRKWVESETKEGERADLFRANLQNAILYGANLRGANLQGADLVSANLQWATLGGANLQEAYLIGANLQRANLMTANLQEADLFTGNLQNAILYGANLRGANLQGADLRHANLREAYLRDARDLTADQVKAAKNWELGFYSDDLLKELGLPPDHNKTVKKKLAELEKEKKATGGK